VRGDLAVAGVDPHREPAGKEAAHLAKPRGVALRLGADHEASEAEIEQLADRRFLADAAANFDLERNRLHDFPDDVAIDEQAVARAVEIDQVEMLRSGRLKLARDRNGIVAEDRFAAVIALLEADAFAAAQVNGRPNLHRQRGPRREETRGSKRHAEYGTGPVAKQQAGGAS
jgi:hypothetical protein